MTLRLSNKTWQIRPFDTAKASALASSLGVSRVMGNLLVQRGLEQVEEASRFLNPNLNDLLDPNLFVEMPQATDRILRALENGERVLIHGDYDVDGIAASALVAQYLRRRGLQTDVILPSRFEEGYGLSPDKLRESAANRYSLLLTVDCGISAADEIALAVSLGMDVIVTDHHEPSSGRPEKATAVINPKLPDSGYPHAVLSGTGVAYKLIEALEYRFRALGDEKLNLRQWHDLVALGTIADVVPLLGENRILARSGVACLRSSENPGLKALVEKSGLIQENLGVWAVAFVIAPRLNAAGRLGDPKTALDLLMATDYDEALDVAGILEEINRERKLREGEVRKDCDRMIADSPEIAQNKLLLLAKPDWHKGVLGIVASRMVETYGRPSILLTIENGEAQGSGRSISGFDLVGCLSECKDLLSSYGGHEGAAGLRLPERNLPALRERLVQVARERMTDKQLTPPLLLDGELALDDLTDALVTELEMLEPFGEGNRAPLFMTRDLEINSSIQLFGNNHLKFVLGTPARPIEAVAFSGGDLLPLLTSSTVDIAYTVAKRTFRGQQRMELLIKDIRLPESPPSSPNTGSQQRRVVDWRGREDRLQCIQRESEKREGACIFVVDDEEPFRLELLEWLNSKGNQASPIEATCFGDAYQRISREGYGMAIAPVWRNKAISLSDTPKTPLCLRIFLLSLPMGDFGGTARLFDGIKKHFGELWVYLAFGRQESARKVALVSESYPDDSLLRNAYRHLQAMANNGVVRLAHALEQWSLKGSSPMSLQASLAIFEELQLADLVDQDTMVQLRKSPLKRSLEESSTYRHGKIQRELFEQWAKWVLKAPAPEVARKL